VIASSVVLTPNARATMPEYRAYIIGSDGHFQSAEVITADDDVSALTLADKFVNGHDVEVWLLDRKVAVLPCKER
jgi:hypothetical protein